VTSDAVTSVAVTSVALMSYAVPGAESSASMLSAVLASDSIP
jgi:hypothetical protein